MADKSNSRRGILKMTFSLYNNPHIPRDAIQDIISMIENFISDIPSSYIPSLQQEIAKEFVDSNNRDILMKLKIVLEENKYPIKQFSTEHMRFKMYEKYSSFTQPELHKIADDFEFINNVIYKTILVYATTVSIRNVLGNILNIPGLFQEVIHYVRSLKSKKVAISNIMQGRLWQRKYAHLKELTLLVFIYYDDFDLGNAMGSHAGEQELEGLYLCLQFLPPHLMAKQNNIFVISLCYTKHRKKFGYRVILKKIVEELNSLSTAGIDLNFY